MKPTVITANQASAAGGGNNTGNGNGSPAGPGISIPINRDYGGNMHSSSPQQQQHYQHPQYYNNQQQPALYGSPRQQQQPQSHHHQVPTNQQQHFQPTFGFEPDMDMDMDNMFPRSRLGRMHHDPFAGFGGTHFGFPQMSTMGRRGRVAGGANNHMEHEDDFFNRLPSEFRQYIPAGFGARHQQQPQPQQMHPQQHQQAPPHPPQQQPHQQPPPQHHQQYYQQDYQQPQQQQHQVHPVVQSPSKRLCDAAIQTEDPAAGRSEVDCAPTVNLNQHGLRNTMDMGVKSAAEQDPSSRSHSAPPPEQQQLNQQYQQQQHPHPNQSQQFGTQTTPPVQQTNYAAQQQQPPQFQRSFYPPQQQAHPQQKQQTPPPPQTPGGSYVRTIPIFVEGRTEPIINAHKEIPNQNAGGAQAQAQAHASSHATAQASAQSQSQPQAAFQRPGPLNTQAQPEQQQQLGADGNAGVPPQTPHTQDSIKKIQDIQRDVLELMAKVEQFKGTRQDKEYVYLDEMLTRNLLKLDTIDTNGKDSIRLARKEAIKCIQASVNVLDAKAEENGRIASGVESSETVAAAAATAAETPGALEAETGAAVAEPTTPQPLDATKIQEPIPLPPPPSVVADSTPNAAEQANATTVEADGGAKVESESTTVTEKSE